MLKINFKASVALMLAIIMGISAIGCGGVDTPPETTLSTATPEATLGESTSASEPETTPSEFPESTPSETPETTADPDREYNISYDLDGGVDGGNPTVYDGGSEITLIAPVREGYAFAGWLGNGTAEPTTSMKIEKGTKGDLAFKATWIAFKDSVGGEFDERPVDTTYHGADDGIAPSNEELKPSVYDELGDRDEGIFTLKTVYTDISVDGVMDAAYTYGLYFKSDIVSVSNAYYKNNEVGFEVYMIRGQDGRIYVYADVTDPTVIVNESIFNDKKWHVDCLDLYFEFGNYGKDYTMYSFVADPTGKFKRDMPEDVKIVLTEKGYAVEFSMDNNGNPVMHNEEMSFQFYLNDTYEWDPETNGRKKGLLKHSSVHNPVEAGYILPSPTLHDAVRCSAESASGRVNVSDLDNERSGDVIADVINRAASIVLVYDKNATAQSVLPAQNLALYLSAKGAKVDIVYEEDLTDPSKYDYTVYFGMSDNERASELISRLSYVDYGVAVYGDCAVFLGWNEAASAAAEGLLQSVFKYVENGGKTEDMVGAVYTGTVTDQVGADIPKLDGFDSVTDVGEGAFQIYKLESTSDEYEEYLGRLEAAGYARYTDNVMATVLCATYVSDDTVVNVQYGGETDKSIRIIVEPLENTALPMLEAPEDADSEVMVSSVTMMSPHNLCLVIQLSNGHFIIVDSGNNGTQKALSDFLREKAPDGKPVVEAWIFTHFHQDHIGGFIDYTGQSGLMRYITIESIIYNFPSNQVIMTAGHSVTDMKNVTFWYNSRIPSLKEKGTTVYKARTGQKYYFGNAEIEILWTFEDIMPHNVFTDRTNPTCIGFSITLAGQKIMVTGDSSAEEFTVAYKKYGSYLKSDFVQLSHHGYGDGGSPIEFYDTVAAPYVFNPGNGITYGEAEKETANKAEKLFVRDDLGICTVTLPYSGGDVTSEKE